MTGFYLFLAVLVQNALTETTQREIFSPTFSAGSELHIRFRDSEQRDSYFCEPYEEMYVEDDDCSVYCMVNSKLHTAERRPKVDQLKTCVPL